MERYGKEKFIQLLKQLKDGFGDTLVHVAATAGDLRYWLKLLIDKLRSFYTIACICMCSMLDLMYQEAGDSILTYTGQYGRWPIHSASGFGKVETVAKLFEWDKSRLSLEATYLPPKLPKFTSEKEQVGLVKLYM